MTGRIDIYVFVRHLHAFSMTLESVSSKCEIEEFRTIHVIVNLL